MNKDIVPVLVGGIGEINFGKQYRQGNRIYDANAIAMACLSSPVGNAGGYSYLYMIGDLDMNKIPSFVNGEICKTVRASGHGSTDRHSWDMVAVKETNMNNEPFIVASRGRNPENPSDRTPGAPTEQRLELNKQGLCNTLTIVQKDNYVAEPKQNNLRIRKLTPKECWRLMGFGVLREDGTWDDEMFEKAEAVNSNTQLYKQAGNSIVVNCIEEILRSLFKKED